MIPDLRIAAALERIAAALEGQAVAGDRLFALMQDADTLPSDRASAESATTPTPPLPEIQYRPAQELHGDGLVASAVFALPNAQGSLHYAYDASSDGFKLAWRTHLGQWLVLRGGPET